MLDVKKGDFVVKFDPWPPATNDYIVGTVEIVHKTQFVALFGDGWCRHFYLSDGLEVNPVHPGAKVHLMTEAVKAEMARIDSVRQVRD